MLKLMWKSTALIAALVAAAAVTSTANAGLLPVTVGVGQDGANYRYTYGVVLTSDAVLQAGDYFTVHDFGGFVDGSSTAPTGFTLNAASKTPERVNPGDNPGIPDLTWTYNGPTATMGPANLGDFSAVSSYASTADGTFTARTHTQVGDKVDTNITDTQVPIPAPPAVPEPSALLLAVLGLSLAGGLRWLK